MMRCKTMRSIVFWILLVSVVVSGCSKAKTDDGHNSVDGTLIEENGHIQAELADNLIVDADFTGPERTSYDVYYADMNDEDAPSLKEVQELLFHPEYGEPTVNEGEGDAFVSLQGIEGCFLSPKEKNYMYYFYHEVPQYVETVGGGSDMLRFYERIEIEHPEELQELSMQEALEIVHKLGDNLGLNLDETPVIAAALDKEALIRLSELENGYIHMMGKEYDWEDRDSCYYFLFHSALDGTMIASSNYHDYFNAHTMTAQGSRTVIILLEDGTVQYLESQYGYHVTGTKETKEIAIYPKDIPELIRRYYENDILSSPHTVEKIDFCYIPKQIKSSPKGNEFELVPGYQVVIEVPFNDAGEQSEVIYFDAETGVEF